MLRAFAGTLVVSGVPGILVAVILGLRLRTLSTWAAIPAFSLSIVFVLGELEMLFHAPFGPAAFGVLLVVLAAGAVIAVRARAGRSGASTGAAVAFDPERAVLDSIDRALLVVGIAFGALVWGRGLRGVPHIPPGGDATRHGFFVERIISGHSIDPLKVVTSDAAGHHAAAKFYPLALHASAALATTLSRGDVGRVLVAYVLLFAVVMLPVGMFLLARTLAPERPLVAGFTALVVPLLFLYPYQPVWAGDIPQMVGMALVPITVVLVVRAANAPPSDDASWRDKVSAIIPPALAILCITAVHTSELPVVALLALLLVLEHALVHRDLIALRRALWSGALAAALALVLYAPNLAGFANGVSERAPVNIFNARGPQATGALAREALLWLHYFVTPRQVVLALLALAGAVIWLTWKRVAWLVGWFAFAILTVLTISPHRGLLYDVTFPWYHLEGRVLPNVAFFVPVFAGAALASATVLATRVLRGPRATASAAFACAITALLVIGIPTYRSGTRFVHDSFDPGTTRFFNQALVGNSTLRSFRWLHDHASTQDTVANRPIDGSLWMYAEAHVTPLIGATFREVTPELADRMYVTSHLQLLGHDAKTDALVRRYHVRWVFFDAKAIPLGPPTFALAALQSNPALTAVFHDGTTWVFRIHS